MTWSFPSQRAVSMGMPYGACSTRPAAPARPATRPPPSRLAIGQVRRHHRIRVMCLVTLTGCSPRLGRDGAMMDVSAAVGSGRAHVAGGPPHLGLPAPHDVLGGFNAVAPSCGAAQPVEADTRRPDAGANPVEHPGPGFVGKIPNS